MMAKQSTARLRPSWRALVLALVCLSAGALLATGPDISLAQQTPPAGLAEEQPVSGELPGQTAPDGEAAQPPGEPAADPDRRVARPGETGLSPLARIGIVAAVFLIPLLLGHYLAGVLRMPDYEWRISVALFAIVAGLTITVLGWPPKLGLDLRGGAILIYQVEDADFNMEQLVTEVTQRVNPGGIREVAVRPYGEREIQISIPEADENELQRIEYILSTTGQLEFRILATRDDDEDIVSLATGEQFDNVTEVTDEAEDGTQEVVAKWVPVAKEEAARYAASDYYATRLNKRGELEVLVLMDPFNVTGEYLTKASPGVDRNNRPAVNFSFDSAGARRFGNLTGRNLPDPAQPNKTRALGIVLDRYLRSAPAIRERINRDGEITGEFTEQEVKDLAAVLTAGALPATLVKEPTSRLLTGPTLGRDMIDKGVRAMTVSTIIVVLFMIVYYRFAGCVANLALLLNVMLIVAFMILFNAAFTLAGLAGLALTVGMAVDANVLIYERMREELKRGATMRMAIRNGFDRATTTIIDANVTTLISAIVLYAIGTDQVKGFAVTLILGIMMNLFTAITCSRLVFDVSEKMRWITQLKMLRILENPNFDFVGKCKPAIALSIVVIGIGLAAVVARGKGLLDIDFTGGVSVEALFEEPQSIAYVRERVQDLPDVTVQDVKISDEPAGKRFLIVTSEPKIDEVKAKLKSIFDEPNHHLAFNHLEWSLEPIPPPGQEAPARGAGQEQPPAGRPRPAEDRQGAGDPADQRPSADEGALRARADEGLLAMADGAPWTSAPTTLAQNTTLAQDTGAAADPQPPSAGSAAQSDEADRESEQAEKPQSEAADAGRATSGGAVAPAEATRATLKFTEKIDHDTLARELQAVLATKGRDEVPFGLDNPEYEEGITRGFAQWTLEVDLGPDETRQVLGQLEEKFASEPVFPSSNKIGASVAANTQWQASYALLASLFLIIVYVWIRFQQVSFGFAAVLAVVHDVLVALGALALSLWLANYLGFVLIEPFKINLTIIAAFLTIIGYSLNDTIVIFDRIRELRGKSTELGPELVNLCINQTLSRTILTSLTVFIVVVILYVFGGQGLHGFAFTLVVGTISGTYSTVYIATPVLIWMNRGWRRGTTAPGASQDRRAPAPAAPSPGGFTSRMMALPGRFVRKLLWS
ncbi:MAG: protein translocase subunit SecD [Pirellulales bacterium]